MGLTALPNAAANAAGGLPISNDGGFDVDAILERLTADRAGYIDKLNVSGILAHSDAASTYKANVTNLDAAVSTRSSHAAADIWSVVTRSLTDKAGFTLSGTVQTLDALITALNTAHGAGSWATATGFSTHAAADIWSVVTRTLTEKTGFSLSGTLQTLDALKADLESTHGSGSWATAVGFSTHSASDIWGVGTRTLTDKAGYSLAGAVQTLDALITALNSAHGSGSWLTATGFSTLTASEVNTEVDNALNTAIPGTPTAGSINALIKALDDLTKASGPGDLAAMKAIIDNLPDGFKKNTAVDNFTFVMVDETDGYTAEPGMTVTAEVTKDGGAWGAISGGSVTEISQGAYKVNLAAADFNCNFGMLRFSATGCRTIHLPFKTQV